MVTRRSPLYRCSGLALAACGALAVMTRPGFSAPTRGPRPLPAPVPRAVPKPLPQPAVPPPGNQIMKSSDVRPGMKGYGLTVFRGTTIERFGVTVVDVLPKSNMGQPLVLVRLSGGPISQRGAYLIQGMSGNHLAWGEPEIRHPRRMTHCCNFRLRRAT